MPGWDSGKPQNISQRSLSADREVDLGVVEYEAGVQNTHQNDWSVGIHQQDKQCTCNETMRPVHVTTAAVQKQ